MLKGSYADVIIDISHESVDRPFSYRIPEALAGRIAPGSCVVVPFGGKNQERLGYVISITDTPGCAPERMKEILRLSEKEAFAGNSQIRLAAWMKEQYGSTMIAALKTVLPAKQKTRQLMHRRIVSVLPREELSAYTEECRRKKQNARLRLLEALMLKGELVYEQTVKELRISAETIKGLCEKGVVKVISEAAYRNPVKTQPLSQKQTCVLSDEQRTAAEEILSDFHKGRPQTYLIHGITGSGKTEVYMELIAGMLALGRQAIVLIPEIALTYQTVNRFTARFGDRVSVLHSRLSAGEKYDQCCRAQNGEIDIIVGPRSALFTPFSKLGLIIIDEEHEASYKSESMPKYHAREVAAKIAGYANASLVLGSATPSLETYYAVQRGKIRCFELTKRLTGGVLPEVYVEDMRKELRMGNRSIFSDRLRTLLEDRLLKKEQSMLFLNRRGYAGFVSCRACGHVMKCPHCDVSLAEHKNGRLVCHYCGYEQPSIRQCPACGSKYILGFRAGTEQIEDTLHRMFPGIRVLRMDADTTRKKDSFDKILSAFAGGEADVLLGTQMIVKGHDFPAVTLVGVLAADLSLGAGDYRAGERTFQLLTQAAGRAGRGKKPGEVVIQTYQPEHHSIRYAAAQDYKGFYQEEIGYRELMSYPPAAAMLAVLVLAKEQEKGETLAGKLAEVASQEEIRIIGPAQAAIARLGDIYRSVFYVKSASMQRLIAVKDILEAYLEQNKVQNTAVQFDFDPLIGY